MAKKAGLRRKEKKHRKKVQKILRKLFKQLRNVFRKLHALGGKEMTDPTAHDVMQNERIAAGEERGKKIEGILIKHDGVLATLVKGVAGMLSNQGAQEQREKNRLEAARRAIPVLDRLEQSADAMLAEVQSWGTRNGPAPAAAPTPAPAPATPRRKGQQGRQDSAAPVPAPASTAPSNPPPTTT